MENSADRQGQVPWYHIRKETETEVSTGFGLLESPVYSYCISSSSGTGPRLECEVLKQRLAVNGPEPDRLQGWF